MDAASRAIVALLALACLCATGKIRCKPQRVCRSGGFVWRWPAGTSDCRDARLVEDCDPCYQIECSQAPPACHTAGAPQLRAGAAGRTAAVAAAHQADPLPVPRTELMQACRLRAQSTAPAPKRTGPPALASSPSTLPRMWGPPPLACNPPPESSNAPPASYYILFNLSLRICL
jgi:hypothetical protein